MIDYENNEIQEFIGKMLTKLNLNIGEEVFQKFLETLLQSILLKKDETLPIKRNSAIYLYKIVEYYGKSKAIVQERFIDIQKVFMKFLFDRKPYM